MVGHRCTYADMSTRQVQTLQLQLQQQSFNTYQLTAVKCPHLFSHEMTGQSRLRRFGPISQFSARRIVSS